MAVPNRYLIDALRKLRGDAFVSYPDKSLDVRRVERVYSVLRNAPREAFNAPQLEEYTDTELVDQHVVGGDQQYVEIYQAWETLPGSELTTKIKRTSIFEVIPVEFRVGESLTVVDQAVEPDAEADPVTGQVVESIVQQESRSKAHRKVTTRDADVYPTLHDKTTNARKQVVTNTRDIVSISSAVPSATQDVNVKDLGGGKLLQEVSSVASLFTEATFETERADLLPREFQGAIATRETSVLAAGTAAQPSLGAGDLDAKEEQVTALTKRATRKSRDLASLPIESIDDRVFIREYGGAAGTKKKRLGVQGYYTLDTGLMVVESEIDRLGDGTEVLRSTIGDGSAWPVLSQSEVGEYGEVTPSSRQVVAAGTVVSGVAGATITEEKQIDAVRTEKIVHVAPLSTLDIIVLKFPETANIELPPVLTGVTKIADSASGDGNYDEQITALIAGHGSWSLNPRTTVQSSASIIPDVQIDIKTVWGNDIPAISYSFFMANGTTHSDILTRLATITGVTVHPWPRFRPVAHTIVLVGKRLSISGQMTLTNHYSTNGDGTGSSAAGTGKGTSTESGVSVKTVRIPPTIHPAINFSGSPTLTQSIGGTGTITLGGSPPVTQGISGSVTASISPNSFAATGDDITFRATIPTTGLYLRRVQTKPYRYGQTQRLMVEAQVIDFSNVG